MARQTLGLAGDPGSLAGLGRAASREKGLTGRKPRLLWRLPVWLASNGIRFWRSPDPPTLKRAFRALGLSVLLVTGYVLLGSLVLRAQYNAPLHSRNLLPEIGARLVLGTGPLVPVTRRAGWFLESISAIGVAMLGYLLVAFLRPFVARPAAPSEHARAHDLLRLYGASSLSYFALAEDKSLYFGQRVEGVIAFRVANEVAVVCGDPAVAAEHLPALVEEFKGFCFRNGWELCLYEVAADHKSAYEQSGMRTLKIGEDAWIDLQAFTLKGKPIADIRHAISKVERDGLIFLVIAPGGDLARAHRLLGPDAADCGGADAWRF